MIVEKVLPLWKDVRHFKPEEFNSPDEKASGLRMSIDFVKQLDKLRFFCEFPLKINSGFRTKTHNKKVKGKPSSAHTLGLAADIHCVNSRKRFIIVQEALKLGFKRVGIGNTFVHLDMDDNKPQQVIWLY